MAASLSPYPETEAHPEGGRDSLVGHPALDRLWSLWNEVRGLRPMPARRDFTPERLRAWLGNLALIDVNHAPLRLRYRLVGTRIVENLKFDATGKHLDEFVIDPVNNPMTAGLYRCLTRAEPVLELVRPRYNRFFAFDCSRLSLPLSEGGAEVTMILMGEYILPGTRPGLPGEVQLDQAAKVWF